MMNESIQSIFKMHRKRFNNKLFNIFVKKRLFQSEFAISFIAYFNSRVEGNFEKIYKTINLFF